MDKSKIEVNRNNKRIQKKRRKCQRWVSRKYTFSPKLLASGQSDTERPSPAKIPGQPLSVSEDSLSRWGTAHRLLSMVWPRRFHLSHVITLPRWMSAWLLALMWLPNSAGEIDHYLLCRYIHVYMYFVRCGRLGDTWVRVQFWKWLITDITLYPILAGELLSLV